MYEGSPGVFKNIIACRIVARGYGLEENTPYTIMKKIIEDAPDEETGHIPTWIYYRPVRKEDQESAEKDGYVLVEDTILHYGNI